MKPTKSETITTHHYEIDRQAGCDWPDLQWPEWKPNSQKLMRPDLVRFKITARYGGDPHIGPVHVHGPRLNKGGEFGAQVINDYWRSGKMPDFVRELLAEAKRDMPV